MRMLVVDLICLLSCSVNHSTYYRFLDHAGLCSASRLCHLPLKSHLLLMQMCCGISVIRVLYSPCGTRSICQNAQPWDDNTQLDGQYRYHLVNIYSASFDELWSSLSRSLLLLMFLTKLISTWELMSPLLSVFHPPNIIIIIIVNRIKY